VCVCVCVFACVCEKWMSFNFFSSFARQTCNAQKKFLQSSFFHMHFIIAKTILKIPILRRKWRKRKKNFSLKVVSEKNICRNATQSYYFWLWYLPFFNKFHFIFHCLFSLRCQKCFRLIINPGLPRYILTIIAIKFQP